MLVGTSSVDITPDVGVELCGFANRQQPSDHILDPLYARVLCLDESGVKIILINLDLIGVERSFVQNIRSELNNRHEIPENHIQIFTTHTHSGPGTIHLNFCGEYDSAYVEDLRAKIFEACSEALDIMDPCMPEYYEAELQLGVNRRNHDASALPLKILTWKRSDGICRAVMINYPMHPVCLKGAGISADYPGFVCKKMKEDLPGNPLVLFGLGPAGDIDPPGVGLSNKQIRKWGTTLAQTAINSIKGGLACMENGRLVDQEIGKNVRMGPACPITIPSQTMEPNEIDKYADKYLASKKWNKEFGPVFRKAVEKWRHDMKERTRKEHGVLEISVLEIGILKLVLINAELFSEFEKILEKRLEPPFILISCANGLEGYLPAQEDYEKGGYEVETSLFFYNSFMPEPGSLEIIANETIKLLKNLPR